MSLKNCDEEIRIDLWMRKLAKSDDWIMISASLRSKHSGRSGMIATELT